MNKILLTIKKFLKPLVWKLLDFYEQKISSKSRKVKEFNRIVKTNRICFTTDINTHGFSDQIARLNFFYKVGNSLGFTYHYTPLESSRSSTVSGSDNTGMDIYNFLGINSYLKSISTPISRDDCKQIVINVDEMNFERRAAVSYRNFIFYLKAKIVDQIRGKENILIHFRGSPKVFYFYRLAASINSDLALRECYFAHRRKNPWKTVFEKNKIRLLVHIRQGDTAIIKTPWNTFVGVNYKLQNKKFVEFTGKEEVGDNEFIDVELYYKFLRDLFQHLNTRQISTSVFSDGFKRAFHSIYFHKTLLGLEQSQMDELKELENIYDEAQFKDFKEWENVKAFIGETQDNLFDLVHAFFETDIIIFGTQAKLIPKLVSIYSDPENMPFLINLYQERPPNINYLGIDHFSKRVLFADLQNYDINLISNRIKEFLADRKEVQP